MIVENAQHHGGAATGITNDENYFILKRQIL
jgi:hypothetical protein